MPEPKIYRATDEATEIVDLTPLKGDRNSAQRYVDRITRSQWWRDVCLGVWDPRDPAPPRVWVEQMEDDDSGYSHGFFNVSDIHTYRGQEMPVIVLGEGILADRWSILHELSHVITTHHSDPGFHGPIFVGIFIGAVRYWLGDRAADALLDRCKAHKIRLRYDLI